MKGFEPSTPGATVQCSNQLSYTHHISKLGGWDARKLSSLLASDPPSRISELARQKGFEPLTYGLEGRCSIQLSYWRGISRQKAVCSRRKKKKRGFRLPAADRPLNFWSGRDDLNVRPPAPKAGALPGCATPRQKTQNHSTHARCEIKD